MGYIATKKIEDSSAQQKSNEKELLNLMCEIFEKMMLEQKNNMHQLSPTSKYKKNLASSNKMLKVNFIKGCNTKQEFDSAQQAKLGEVPSVQINNQNFEKLFFGLLVVQSILN